MGDGSLEVILPGLPDDLALMCLAKVSHGYHGLLECVSKRWRDTIRSLDYASIKARDGLCGNWLFVSTVDGKDQWDAYDPDADRWHPLPRMPRSNAGHYGFSCVSICKKFLVIGGCYIVGPSQRRFAINDVMMFDPFKKQWRRAANMRTARTDFACAVICDKVYVAGGGDSNGSEGLAVAEVYDPQTNHWEDLPPMPFPLIECFSISYGGQFHVLGKKEYNIQQDTYVFFDPMDRRWHLVEDLQLYCKLTPYYTTVVDSRIYTISEDGTVKVMDSDHKRWSTVGVFPAVVLPEHCRPLKPFGFGFVGFQQHLYVVGGMTLNYNSNTLAFAIVRLNSCRSCNLMKLPLEWHDTRPMPTRAGRIAGCAFMQE